MFVCWWNIWQPQIIFFVSLAAWYIKIFNKIIRPYIVYYTAETTSLESLAYLIIFLPFGMWPYHTIISFHTHQNWVNLSHIYIQYLSFCGCLFSSFKWYSNATVETHIMACPINPLYGHLANGNSIIWIATYHSSYDVSVRINGAVNHDVCMMHGQGI